MDNLSVTDWCHHFLSLQISPGDLCIDATTGNGHDTAFLASLVGADGQVIGFDIQQSALDAAGKLLRAQGLIDRVRLVLDSHEHIDQYAIPGTVSCITFNLGYLPGGGHAIATKAATTLPAIAAGTLKAEPQAHENASTAPMLSKEMAEFKLTDSADHIHNWVRGMNPWPGAWFVTAGGKKVKVMECRVAESHGEAAGTVLATKPLTVACGEGAVQLLHVVPEGKKPMDGTSFAAGLRLKAGDSL